MTGSLKVFGGCGVRVLGEVWGAGFLFQPCWLVKWLEMLMIPLDHLGMVFFGVSFLQEQ